MAASALPHAFGFHRDLECPGQEMGMARYHLVPLDKPHKTMNVVLFFFRARLTSSCAIGTFNNQYIYYN